MASLKKPPYGWLFFAVAVYHSQSIWVTASHWPGHLRQLGGFGLALHVK